jgi:hypothetical protein
MLSIRTYRYLVCCTSILALVLGASRAAAQQPLAYQIVLRARAGESVPEHSRDGQTGGGSIEVVRRGPDVIEVLMHGAVATGSETHRPGSASLKFLLDQEFDLVAMRPGLRPPQLALAAHLVGTLQVGPGGGSAEQAPACAAINASGEPIVNVCLKPHAVGCGQNLFVNDQVALPEAIVAPGGYCLHQTFAISVSAPPPPFCAFPHMAPAAAATFDPEAKLEGPWSGVLQNFRAVPRRNFGFSVLLTVSESPPPGAVTAPPLPAPRALEAVPPATEK